MFDLQAIFNGREGNEHKMRLAEIAYAHDEKTLGKMIELFSRI